MPDANAQPRPVLSRQVTLRGPRFFREGRELMFVMNYDGSTRDGPRHATDEDKKAHAEAYQAYLDELHAPAPFKPVVAFKDPPGGKPPREVGPHERRRNAAAESE